MNNRVVVDRYAFIFADGVIFAAYGRGLKNEAKINLEVKEGRSFSGEYSTYTKSPSLTAIP